MSEQTAPEPTMEEILASIRRIISEDDAPAAKARSGRKSDDSWEPAEIEDPVPAASEAAEPDSKAPEKEEEEPVVAETFQSTPLKAIEAEPVVAEPVFAASVEPAPAPTPTPEPVALTASPAPLEDFKPMPEPAPAPSEPGLIDDDTAKKAASAFDRLAAAATPARRPQPVSSPAMPAAGRTLEDLTRELLQPLIKAWLDENLPGIVQSRVDEEVERITRRVR